MYEENLNYFRGFFATLVVFAHTYQILLLPLFYSETSVILSIIQFIAAYSVVGFILISGYSIASSLHLNYLKNNKNDIFTIYISLYIMTIICWTTDNLAGYFNYLIIYYILIMNNIEYEKWCIMEEKWKKI